MLFYVCFVLYICFSLCLSLFYSLSCLLLLLYPPGFQQDGSSFRRLSCQTYQQRYQQALILPFQRQIHPNYVVLVTNSSLLITFCTNKSSVAFPECHTHVSSQPWGCCLFLLLGELEIKTPHSGALAPLFMVHNNVQAFSRLCNHHKHPVPRSNRCIFAANASTWCQSQTFLPVNKRCAQACIYFNKLARES